MASTWADETKSFGSSGVLKKTLGLEEAIDSSGATMSKLFGFVYVIVMVPVRPERTYCGTLRAT